MPEKADPERDRVAAVWVAAGGSVTRLGRFWEPPALDPRAVRIYANDTFALVLAQKLRLKLVSPEDDLLVRLPTKWLKRQISICSLAESAGLPYPAFIKPVVPKTFRARVYQDRTSLMAECKGLEMEAKIYVSEVVRLSAEARSFMLRGEVQDIALYEGDVTLREAEALAKEVARSDFLPETCVIDFGLADDRGWAVVEANASWGAGLNGCSPERVIQCIAAATKVEV